MLRSLLCFMFVLAAADSSRAAVCATHLRVVHGHAFEDGPVDVKVNGQYLVRGLSFRSVSDYLSVSHGSKSVQFFKANTKEMIGEKTFPAASGAAYTVVVAGPAAGPRGLLFGNTSPFVFMDDVTPPNPGRWKGHWYRMSETDVVIDFRISDGNDSSNELYRLVNKPNRAAYQLGDIPAGFYQFNPVMPGDSQPFFNTALSPARNVELTRQSIAGGEVYDIFALGNFLGRGPNSLDLTSVKYRPVLDANGCISIQR